MIRVALLTHAEYDNGTIRYGSVIALATAIRAAGYECRLFDAPLHRQSAVFHLFDMMSLFIAAAAYRPDVVIGADPLNGVVAGALRRTRLVPSAIFYCVDYAEKRFHSPLLNMLYHRFDRWSMWTTDATWSVSTRIADYRQSNFGLEPRRNRVIPNAPIDPIPRRTPMRHSEVRFIIVSHIERTIDWEAIITAFEFVRAEGSWSLTIVGGGSMAEDLRRRVQRSAIADRVTLTGALPHDDAMTMLANADVGLAIYGTATAWTRFGDSLKIREYAAAGLAIITTQQPSTADDVRKWDAGIILEDMDDLSCALQTLIHDTPRLERYGANALLMAAASDLRSVVHGALLDMRPHHCRGNCGNPA